jgi:hypothetical protein
MKCDYAKPYWPHPPMFIVIQIGSILFVSFHSRWPRLHHSPGANTFPRFKLRCLVYIKCFSKRINFTRLYPGYVQPFSVVLTCYAYPLGSGTRPLTVLPTNNTNGTAHIRHQCRKTTVLSCHRCLINSGVEEMNNI